MKLLNETNKVIYRLGCQREGKQLQVVYNEDGKGYKSFSSYQEAADFRDNINQHTDQCTYFVIKHTINSMMELVE